MRRYAALYGFLFTSHLRSMLEYKKLLSYSDTFSDGNFNHGNANDIFGGLGEDFEVFGQASKSA